MESRAISSTLPCANARQHASFSHSLASGRKKGDVEEERKGGEEKYTRSMSKKRRPPYSKAHLTRRDLPGTATNRGCGYYSQHARRRHDEKKYPLPRSAVTSLRCTAESLLIDAPGRYEAVESGGNNVYARRIGF